MTEFAGIPIAALDFFEDLENDNSKSWWQAHREIYDEQVRAPAEALLAELEPEFGPSKIFRPYRDVRFSKDKSPYKTHLGAVVSTAPGIGYYLHIDAAGLSVGAGWYGSSPDRVARYREVVDTDARGTELATLTDAVTTAGFELSGERLKRAPRGFATDHPLLDLLRHRSLVLRREFECPPWLSTPRARDEIADAWRVTSPLVDWLTQVLGELEVRR